MSVKKTVTVMAALLGAMLLILSIMTGSLRDLLLWMGPANVLLVSICLGLLLIFWGRHLIRKSSSAKK